MLKVLFALLDLCLICAHRLICMFVFVFFLFVTPVCRLILLQRILYQSLLCFTSTFFLSLCYFVKYILLNVSCKEKQEISHGV